MEVGQGLKPSDFLKVIVARLRPCPDSRPGEFSARLRPCPFANLRGVAMLVLCICLLATTVKLRAQDAVVIHSTPSKEPGQENRVAPVGAADLGMGPIAIVPLDGVGPNGAPTVTGALEVTKGRAIIATSGAVTAGDRTTAVALPQRGVLRVCALTTVKLATDSGVAAGEVPGLMMAIDHGAIEASFATGRDSDTVMTPDFRILIGGPGVAEVKVRLGQGGDTCVENAGVNAPYVLVTSVFDGGAYRVQAGQRVMFQHGNLHEVVDQEKEPCGCPPDAEPKSNEFPLAQSEGLTTKAPPVTDPVGHAAVTEGTLAYKGDAQATTPAVADDAGKAGGSGAQAAAPEKKRSGGFFGAIGRFFKRIFGAE